MSTLPQVRHSTSRSRTWSSAARSCTSAVSRRLISHSTARRAERGPSPGSRDSAEVSASISCDAMRQALTDRAELVEARHCTTLRRQPFDKLGWTLCEYLHGNPGLRRAGVECAGRGGARGGLRLYPAAAPGRAARAGADALAGAARGGGAGHCRAASGSASRARPSRLSSPRSMPTSAWSPPMA